MYYRMIARSFLPRQMRRSLATVANNPNGSGLPVTVKPSAEEIKSRTLGARNLETAVRHMHRDGLVVIEDVVPHAALDALNIKMAQDARTLQARGEDGPFNYNLGNLQQDAPPVAKYFNPSIFISELRNPCHTDSDWS